MKQEEAIVGTLVIDPAGNRYTIRKILHHGWASCKPLYPLPRIYGGGMSIRKRTLRIASLTVVNEKPKQEEGS